MGNWENKQKRKVKYIKPLLHARHSTNYLHISSHLSLITVSLLRSELAEERSSVLFIMNAQCLTEFWYIAGAQYVLAIKFSWCIKWRSERLSNIFKIVMSLVGHDSIGIRIWHCTHVSFTAVSYVFFNLNITSFLTNRLVDLYHASGYYILFLNVRLLSKCFPICYFGSAYSYPLAKHDQDL